MTTLTTIAEPPVEPDGRVLLLRNVREAQLALERLAWRATWLFRMRATLTWLAAVLSVGVACALLDFVFRVEEVGWRWLLTLTWVASGIYFARLWLLPAWHFRLDSLSVSKWIERVHPEWGNRLSSSLALATLPDADTRYGSAQLRQLALKQLDGEPIELRPQSILQSQTVARLAIGLSVFCVILLGLMIAQPSVVRPALARLIMPWKSFTWPRHDELVFVDLPSIVASGSDLPIQVRDQRPPLPQSVTLEVRQSNANYEKPIERVTLQILTDIGIATLRDVQNSIELRLVGGDYKDAPWTKVQVTQVPQLREHHYEVQPPEYVRQPAATLIGERIEVLAGSKVIFVGTLDGPVASITAKSDDPIQNSDSLSSQLPTKNSASLGSNPASWLGKLSAESNSFVLFDAPNQTLVTEDRKFGLQMQTVEGLQYLDSKRWVIHSVPDRAPNASLMALKSSMATRDASIQLRGDATDDIEIVEVALVWQPSGNTNSAAGTGGRKVLWLSAAHDQNSTPGASSDGTVYEPVRNTSFDVPWDLSELGLNIGQNVALGIEAKDSLGQVTRSTTQNLQIRDPQEVLAHIRSEESEIFDSLRDILDAQKRSQQAIERSVAVIEESRRVDDTLSDGIQSAFQLEQSIVQQLDQSPTSVTSRLDDLAKQIESNRLQNTTASDEISKLQKQIASIRDETLQQILADMSSLQQEMQTSTSDSKDADVQSLTSKLQNLGQQQRKLSGQLSEIVRSIATTESIIDFQNRLTRLLNEQNQLRSETEQFQIDAASGQTDQDGRRAGLRSDQQALARGVDELIQAIDRHLQKDSESPAASNPIDNNTTNKLLENVRRDLAAQQASDQMRDAAEHLFANQLSDAIAKQRKAMQSLDQAASNFRDGDDSQLAAASADLRDMARELERLSDRESNVANQLADESQSDMRAAIEEQSNVAQEANKLAQSLRQRGNSSLMELVDSGAKSAEESSKTASNDRKRAQQLAERAAASFREAEAATERRAESVDRQLALQRMLELIDGLHQLVESQTAIVDQVRNVASEMESKGTAPTDVQASDLAQRQESTRQQLRTLVVETSAPEPFAWLLQRSESDMMRAIAAIERSKIAPDAVTNSSSALSKLSAGLDALESTVAKENPNGENQFDAVENVDQNQDDSQASKKNAPLVASLKLLRALQIQLNDQTSKLDLNDSAMIQLANVLAQEQEQLAEQVRQLMERVQQ